jgi:hypothetical protein
MNADLGDLPKSVIPIIILDVQACHVYANAAFTTHLPAQEYDTYCVYLVSCLSLALFAQQIIDVIGTCPKINNEE